MCTVLDIIRSSYYDWKNKEPSQRDLENQKILETAQESYNESGGIYGLDKLLKDVREKFPKCGRKTERPNAIWVTEISYLDTLEGWLYLAIVKDIHTKDIIGWASAASSSEAQPEAPLQPKTFLNHIRGLTMP